MAIHVSGEVIIGECVVGVTILGTHVCTCYLPDSSKGIGTYLNAISEVKCFKNELKMRNPTVSEHVIMGDLNVRMPYIEGVTEELGYPWGSGETCERQ